MVWWVGRCELGLLRMVFIYTLGSLYVVVHYPKVKENGRSTWNSAKGWVGVRRVGRRG